MKDVSTIYKERVFISFLLNSLPYFYETIGSIKADYFDSTEHERIFNLVHAHFTEFNQVPTFDILRLAASEQYDTTNTEKLSDALTEIEKVKANHEKHYDWAIEKTDEWIRNNSMKLAIIDCVDHLEKGDYQSIEEQIRNALLAGIKSDIGLVYFEKIKDRIERLKQFLKNRLKTGYETMDKIMNGGIYTPSLVVFLGKINIGKSLILTNLTRNFSLAGKSVVLLTMEIPEDLMAMRMDAHLLGEDINEIYHKTSSIESLIKNVTSLREADAGEVYIKEMPPSMTTTHDIRRYLNELKIMGKKFDVILIDYINLIGTGGKSDAMYQDKKKIAEELRAISFIWKAPVITVSQLNREGYFKDFDELDIENSSESMGIPAAADFMGIMGKDEGVMYTNELGMKIVKNRMGAKDGIGTINFYLNPFSLRLYDNEKEYVDSFDVSGGAPAVKDMEDSAPKTKTKKKTKKEDPKDDDLDFFLS